jgi:hypothetical protein
MPSNEWLLRALDANLWMMDQNIGDLFLNFELHKSEKLFMGIVLCPILDTDGKIAWERSM